MNTDQRFQFNEIKLRDTTKKSDQSTRNQHNFTSESVVILELIYGYVIVARYVRAFCVFWHGGYQLKI